MDSRAPDKSIAIWDWEREPVPSARVVVCRPGLFDAPRDVKRLAKAQTACFPIPFGKRVVVASFHASAIDSALQGEWMPGVIPAIYAEWQSDFARLPDLLAVSAERHALVLCPREILNLAVSPERMVPYGMTCGLDADLVVIIPPPDARTCADCNARNAALVFDPACVTCKGTGRLEPWPMHPAWIRGIAEQCRAAEVPIAFLGWGEWKPMSECVLGDERFEHRYVWHAAEGDPTDLPISCYKTGSKRSGRTLDDEKVMDLPEWLFSANPSAEPR